jgi:hypothetical protein
MDRVERYREIVTRVIGEYARWTPSRGEIETETVIDREHDHYELMHVGWDGPGGQRRVHGCVIHVDIRGGKIWVQHDGTDRPIAEELLTAGVPKEDIVLAFHPPDVRRHTGFAVG